MGNERDIDGRQSRMAHIEVEAHIDKKFDHRQRLGRFDEAVAESAARIAVACDQSVRIDRPDP
ncbi:hypothetical protein D3C87_2007560 [compost metagenome]